MKLNHCEASRALALLAAAVLSGAHALQATPLTVVPPGLAAGAEYRLVFITDQVYVPSSSNISTYNTDVTNDADAVASLAALDTTWSVIGSTLTVNAIDNIGADPGVPVYDFSGDLVANDASSAAPGDLFNNDIGPIETSQSGEVYAGSGSTIAYTGTLPTGEADTCNTYTGCGNYLGSFEYADYGYSSSTGAAAIDGGLQPYGYPGHLYGISGILTVPTPEPGTLPTMAAGAALLFAGIWRRRAVR